VDERAALLVEAELPAVLAWAARNTVPLMWNRETLEIRGEWTQPETEEAFYLRGHFDSYRELPPRWSFTDAEYFEERAVHLYPRLAKSPFGSSMFIVHKHAGVICAPFNRFAYGSHGGPHGSWIASQWLAAGAPDQVRAHTLGDMLVRLRTEFQLSRGRLSE
jgi:hypothetical protein